MLESGQDFEALQIYRNWLPSLLLLPSSLTSISNTPQTSKKKIKDSHPKTFRKNSTTPFVHSPSLLCMVIIIRVLFNPPKNYRCLLDLVNLSTLKNRPLPTFPSKPGMLTNVLPAMSS